MDSQSSHSTSNQFLSTEDLLNQIYSDLNPPSSSFLHRHPLPSLKTIFLIFLDLFLFLNFIYYTLLNNEYLLLHYGPTALQTSPYALYSVCFFALALLLTGFLVGFLFAKRNMRRVSNT